MYAVTLANGESLSFRSLKADTISKYLSAASTFLAMFNGVDSRKANPADKSLAPKIQAILNEVKRWEKVPNRREPYEWAMQDTLEGWAATETSLDGPFAALSDWFNNGLYAGYRLSEFAQSSHKSDPDDAERNMYERIKAFTIDDVTFIGANKRSLITPRVAMTCDPDMITGVKLRWETQKNGNNGEERLFARHPSHPKRCFVNRMLSIVTRYYRLAGSSTRDWPLSIYRDTNGVIRSVNANLVTTTMHDLASATYNLSPKHNREAQLIKQFSAHSLRVGACCLLYAKSYTAIQIKFLLRWKSDTFLTYLRNMFAVATQVAADITADDPMPQAF
mmetsp:Transcript_4247/g.5865  ORF Transcript_4247/g.5865 Transcript_4247/m.5865 type:complete len:334 (-) Transcript_4247:48-1049(-)